MIAIWDTDCLVYQVGFQADAYARYLAQERGEEPCPASWDTVEDMLVRRIDDVMHEVEATESVFYLGSHTNFRNDISQTGYKKRTGEKPFHYRNIRAVMEGIYGAISQEGLEADDLCCIKATENPDNSIIISIDKDLRQMGCWHYSWEYGNVASFGPKKTEGYGELEMRGKTLKGMGDKFFLAQCIMGDPTDSIIGIPGSGPAKAFKLLSPTQTYEEGLEAVVEAYKGFYGGEWEPKLTENAQLLWMVRELNEDGSPVLWRM